MAKRYLSENNLRLLYFSVVNPYLLYGNLLWGSAYKKYVHKLVVLQKKAIRAITHSRYNESTSPLFKRLGILKLEDIHTLELGKLLYNENKQSLPSPILNLFEHNSEVHSYNTRQQSDIHVNKIKSDIVFRSFIYKGPNVWSKLPQSIKIAKSANSFGSQLKKQILNMY